MRRWAFVAMLGLILGLAIPAMAQGTNDNPPCNVYGGYYYVHASVNVSGGTTTTTTTTVGGVRIGPQVRAGGNDPTVGYNFNGGGGQVACNLRVKWLSVVGDFAGYTTSSNQTSGNLFTYLFGPRVTVPGHTFQPFVQALFGGAWINKNLSATGASQNVFAVAAGGGIDFNVNEHFFVRPVQAEYLYTQFVTGSGNNTQNNFRYSAGVGFRFP